MNNDQNEIGLDYEGMYKQLAQEKREYKDQLSAVIFSSTTLEFAINGLIEVGVKKAESPLLEKQLKDAYIPISSKLRMLRFANLINDDLYMNLIILFKIRNKFSHELFITAKDSTTVFELLENTRITNTFLKELPNDSKKFELVVSKCSVGLIRIMQRLDPSSVLELELVGDIEEIHEYE